MGFITVLLIAVGLSMDAFSLAILYGTLNFTRKKAVILAFSVGMFHFFMPLLGSMLGIVIMKFLPFHPDVIVGSIFLIIALQMGVSIYKKEEVNDISGILSFMLFAFTVSIDSFTVGIGLASVYSNIFLAAIVFSIISFIFTFVGLTIGGKLNDAFGKISTLIGSIILLALSISHMFFH